MATQKAGDCPMLAVHLGSGHIYSDKGEYFGIASDGTHVLMGNVGQEDALEAYLDDYPQPACW
jgi:hypothetical protein